MNKWISYTHSLCLIIYADVVAKLAAGTHPFSKKLEQAKRPVVVVGSECLQVNFQYLLHG